MKKQNIPNKGSEKKIRNEITEEQKKEIRDAYEPFEENGINPNDLKLAMKALGFDPKNEEVSRILSNIDSKGKSTYTFDSFLDLMIEKPNKDPKVEMEKAIKILSEEGKDKITLKSMKKICAELSENIIDDELNEMIGEADKDDDMEVSIEDFNAIMSKANMF